MVVESVVSCLIKNYFLNNSVDFDKKKYIFVTLKYSKNKLL